MGRVCKEDREGMKVTKFLDLELLELEEPNLRRPSYMIVGIPDAGLVGEIATEYLINSWA